MQYSDMNERQQLVKNILEARSWSLPEMADYFGVNHTTAWRWLKNGPSEKGMAIEMLRQEWKRIERNKGK